MDHVSQRLGRPPQRPQGILPCRLVRQHCIQRAVLIGQSRQHGSGEQGSILQGTGLNWCFDRQSADALPKTRWTAPRTATTERTVATARVRLLNRRTDDEWTITSYFNNLEEYWWRGCGLDRRHSAFSTWCFSSCLYTLGVLILGGMTRHTSWHFGVGFGLASALGRWWNLSLCIPHSVFISLWPLWPLPNSPAAATHHYSSPPLRRAVEYPCQDDPNWQRPTSLAT